jgi:hypothetical protein
MFKDPVSCNSGHTFERKNIMELLQINNRCPKARIIITFIFPNYSLRNLIDQFVENYKNQKGEHWDQVVKECLAYESYPNRVNDPIHINAHAPRAEPNTILDPRASTSTFMPHRGRFGGCGRPARDDCLCSSCYWTRARARAHATETLVPADAAFVGVGFGGAAPIERSTETLVPADAAFVGVGFGGAAPIERPQKRSLVQRLSYRLSRSRRRREERDLEWRAELARRIEAREAREEIARSEREAREENDRRVQEARRIREITEMPQREREHMQRFTEAYDLKEYGKAWGSLEGMSSSLYSMVTGDRAKRDRVINRELERWRTEYNRRVDMGHEWVSHNCWYIPRAVELAEIAAGLRRAPAVAPHRFNCLCSSCCAGGWTPWSESDR